MTTGAAARHVHNADRFGDNVMWEYTMATAQTGLWLRQDAATPVWHKRRPVWVKKSSGPREPLAIFLGNDTDRSM
jgi:hypothetical protein